MIPPGSPSVGPPTPPAPAGIERTYFPELDGLRFFAFLAVYLFHGGVPQFARWVNAVVGWLPRGSFAGSLLPRDLGHTVRENGWVGVQWFFLLSGYLITTLLLREERRHGRIDLRTFWARRILRIWPLFYLVLLLAFGVLPWFDGVVWAGYGPAFGRHLPWFAAFLGNWSMALLGPVGNDAASVFWSVCVEEQFYLLGPLLIAWLALRWRIPVAIGLILVGVASRWWLGEIGAGPLLFQYNSLTHLDTLAAGVLLALIHANVPPGRSPARWWGLAPWPLMAATVCLLGREGLGHGSPWGRARDFVLLWACGAGWLVLASSGRGWLCRALSYRRLVWLGKISYGLYMYHEIALWLGRRVDAWLGWFPNNDALIPIGTFAATVGLAAASYYGYESRFLRLKRSWARVPSRPL